MAASTIAAPGLPLEMFEPQLVTAQPAGRPQDVTSLLIRLQDGHTRRRASGERFLIAVCGHDQHTRPLAQALPYLGAGPASEHDTEQRQVGPVRPNVSIAPGPGRQTATWTRRHTESDDLRTLRAVIERSAQHAESAFGATDHRRWLASLPGASPSTVGKVNRAFDRIRQP